MNFIQRKLEEIKNQPEHLQLRSISLIAISIGVVVFVLWLVVFLPFQLFISNKLFGVKAQPAVVTPTPSQLATPLPSLVPQNGGTLDIQTSFQPVATEEMGIIETPVANNP